MMAAGRTPDISRGQMKQIRLRQWRVVHVLECCSLLGGEWSAVVSGVL
jgi:hypothetical protein